MESNSSFKSNHSKCCPCFWSILAKWLRVKNFATGSGQPDTFVDFDHSVNAAIKRLRDALGDSADNPRFVETLARRGYRCIAHVENHARETSGNVEGSEVAAVIQSQLTWLFARDPQKSPICHTFLVGLTSKMASSRPSGDGIAYPIKSLERSRTETLPSSVTFSNALSRS